jgi:ABC-2 type transport system permease protein
MNWNLFIKEIRRNFFSLILWIIIITLFITVTMSVYRTFLANQSKVVGMLSIVPAGLLQFKGISNFNDLLSALGFYAVNNIIYMMVLGSIYAIVISSNILLKEEYDKTAEYLLTRPVTRSEVFLSKLTVVSVNILLLNLVTTLAGFICVEIFKTGSFSIKAFLILSLYTLLLNILFGSIGLFLSVIVKRPKPITTFSIGIVLIMYFIYTLSRITEGIARIGYLSPFKYVNTNVLDPAYSISLWNLLYFTGITLLLTIISYRLYLRKDIYT